MFDFLQPTTDRGHLSVNLSQHRVQYAPMTNGKAHHAADRLLQAIEQKRAPVCVGLDPVVDSLPAALRPRSDEHQVQSIEIFCLKVLHAVAPHVPCVKIQSACFERYRIDGIAILWRVLNTARTLNLQVILDAKRGDIGLTANHYAASVFQPPPPTDKRAAADWLTINTYLGDDGIRPFLREGHGAFALVRTSNPGGDAVQNLELKEGGTVAHAVAAMVAGIGQSNIGMRGYSNLGAVVGATKKKDAVKLRCLMPQQIFLVPGYGAQGGGIDDVLPCFKSDGTGAIVTASRSVIYAFKPDDPQWNVSVGDAAAKFAAEVGKAVGAR